MVISEKLLTVLRNIAEMIASVDDSGEVLQKIVNILASNLEVDVCSIYEFKVDSNELILTATCGLNSESIGKVRMVAGKGLTGNCFKNQEIVNIIHPSSHPDFIFFKNTGEDSFDSFFAIPLVSSGRNVGVLTLQRREPEVFQPVIVDMAKSLAPQLANLIINAGILKNLAAAPVAENVLTKLPDNIIIGGTAVNTGVVHGEAFKFEVREMLDEIEHSTHDNLHDELELLNYSITLTKANTLELENRALSIISEADASIFNAHLLFLEDKTIVDEIKKEITEENHSLEYSIAMVYRRFERKFLSLNDKMFRDRLIDFKDVMLRLLESVHFLRESSNEQQSFDFHSQKMILVAKELMPSDLLRLPVDNLAGIICERGGVTSHVAILTRALEIPALLGASGIMDKVNNFDEIILDCHAEKAYINPSDDIKLSFDELLLAAAEPEQKIVTGLCASSDGVRVFLRANISLICETPMLRKYGADGIGLYRTEFLFIIREYQPTEDVQYKVFSKVVAESNGEVTLRVLDAGGDKQLKFLNLPKEENPALGIRGIRLLMNYPELFKSHLRAILRAGVDSQLKILFPMISNVQEIIAIRALLREVECELKAEQQEFSANFKFGMMLEVPAVLTGLRRFIPHVDFFSIGTNDLQQYLFAAERGREKESSIDCLNPLFLEVLAGIGKILSKYPEKGLSVCGEMAGNPLAAPLLLGAGIHELSMPPKLIPQIRKTIGAFSSKECEKLLRKAIRQNSAADVAKIMEAVFAAKDLDCKQ